MLLVCAVLVLTGLVCAVRALPCPPSWSDRLADRVSRLTSSGDVDQSGPDGAGDQITVDLGPLSRQEVERRLDALAEELERLDRDPEIFARAFHVMVVRAAHEALLVDAARLADQPRFTDQLFAVELMAPSTGPREELEL